MKQVQNAVARFIILSIVFSVLLLATGNIIPPTTDDKVNPNMLNTLGTVNILNLSGTDYRGEDVQNFRIKTLPNVAGGVLYFDDGTTKVVPEENLTIEEADGLKFDPNADYIGDVNFTYVAIDNDGLIGNIGTVTIPLIAPAMNDCPDDTNDTNGTTENCICDPYEESIPVFTDMGLMIMLIMGTLLGVFYSKEERC